MYGARLFAIPADPFSMSVSYPGLFRDALRQGFVCPLDRGRLMGDPISPHFSIVTKPPIIRINIGLTMKKSDDENDTGTDDFSFFRRICGSCRCYF